MDVELLFAGGGVCALGGRRHVTSFPEPALSDCFWLQQSFGAAWKRRNSRIRILPYGLKRKIKVMRGNTSLRLSLRCVFVPLLSVSNASSLANEKLFIEAFPSSVA